MSKVLLGDDYMLWIKAAAMSDFGLIDGQGTLTINRSQANIDTSSKNRSGYKTSAYGNKGITIDVDIIPNLPDVNYSAYELACNTVPSAPFLIEVRKGGVGGLETDAIFACSVYGSISSVAFTMDDKVSSKGQLAIAAAPTIDTLA